MPREGVIQSNYSDNDEGNKMSADLQVVPDKRDGDNPWMVVNQYRKARKIASVVIDLGGTVESMKDATDITVALAAKVAGVGTPTGGVEGVVWALVVELVKEQEARPG